MNGQEFEFNKKLQGRLISYHVIVCAVQGDPVAMDQVIGHYNPYIYYLSRRNVRDDDGYLFPMPNPEIEARLTSRLVQAVVRFKINDRSGQSNESCKD